MSEKLVLQEVRREIQKSKVTEIDGNLYTYWAFLDVMRLGTEYNRCSVENLTLQAGLLFVMLVQIIGPPAVLIYTVYAIDWTDVSVGVYDWRYVHGSMAHGISNVGKRILAFLIIFVFLLNGSYTIQKDQDTSKKIARFVAALDEDEVPIRKHWLWVGAMVNCWVVVVSSLSMVPCFILAKSPKQVIFDSFALLFLFRLDDVCGDLGFMQDTWESEAIGSWYDRIVHFRRWKRRHNKRPSMRPSWGRGDVMEWRTEIEARLGVLEKPDADSDSDESEDPGIHSREGNVQVVREFLRPDQWTELTVYKIALGILAILSPLVPFAYAFVQGAKPKHFSDRAMDLDETLARMEDLHGQVQALQAALHLMTTTATPALP